MAELLKVGQEFDWGVDQGDNSGKMTVVRILSAEEAKKYKLGQNQVMWTGENMLDNPNNEGKFEKNKVYVFES